MKILWKRRLLTFALLVVALVCIWSPAQAQNSRNTRQVQQTVQQIRNTYRRSQQDLNRQLEARRQRTQAYVNARKSTSVRLRYRDLPPLIEALGTVMADPELGAVQVMAPHVIDAYQRQRQTRKH